MDHKYVGFASSSSFQPVNSSQHRVNPRRSSTSKLVGSTSIIRERCERGPNVGENLVLADNEIHVAGVISSGTSRRPAIRRRLEPAAGRVVVPSELHLRIVFVRGCLVNDTEIRVQSFLQQRGNCCWTPSSPAGKLAPLRINFGTISLARLNASNICTSPPCRESTKISVTESVDSTVWPTTNVSHKPSFVPLLIHDSRYRLICYTTI